MLATILTLALAAGPPHESPNVAPRQADQPWSVTVAAWNLLNFGSRKAGLTQNGPLNSDLLDRYAGIMSRYDIVFVQELLDEPSLTQGIAQRTAMANYNCTSISQPSGRSGRKERYGICYAKARIQLNGLRDYTGTTATAENGTTQDAQQVWMRPPLSATFTYTKPDGSLFQFSVYVDHTKPAYSRGLRPAGTPASAPQNSSVHYELKALERNAQQTGNTMVIGDLNADCASYPSQYRGTDFGWPWTWYINYGEKTNTAARSNCAYDRIILNSTLNGFYRGHGIYTQGINERLNGRRVSDHYLVWVRLGGTIVKKRRLVAAVGVTAENGERDFVKDKKVKMNSEGQLPGTSGQLFITQYSPTAYYSGNQTYPLTDVRGAPTPVIVGPDGRFTRDVEWDAPVKGVYTLVLDVNGDGRYDKNDGDFVNYDNQIDLIVLDSRTGYDEVETLGEDGQVRTVFSDDTAQNVYALARNLPANDSVDAYVVSARRLPTGFSWHGPQRFTLLLPSVSIPVNRSSGPIIAPTLSTADRVRRLPTSPEGTLFASVWDEPYRLMNTPVSNQPPPTPTYLPEYATDEESDGAYDASTCQDPMQRPATAEEGCGDDENFVQDPCEGAWRNSDTNLQQVCNVGNLFTDYYGTSFNVVLDVNRNGIFDSGDKVDVDDISAIDAFFANPANTVLDEQANGNPAVGDYKDYLEARLNLSTPLTDDNVYDAATRAASVCYLSEPVLAKRSLDMVRQGARVSFEMLNETDYPNEAKPASSPCATSQNPSAAIITDEPQITGDAAAKSSSTYCTIAYTSASLAVGSLVAPGAAPFAPLFGGPAVLSGIACGLGW